MLILLLFIFIGILKLYKQATCKGYKRQYYIIHDKRQYYL